MPPNLGNTAMGNINICTHLIQSKWVHNMLNARPLLPNILLLFIAASPCWFENVSTSIAKAETRQTAIRLSTREFLSGSDVVAGGELRGETRVRRDSRQGSRAVRPVRLQQYVVEQLSKNYSCAAHAVLSVQNLHKHLRGHLRETWDTLTTWKMELPSQTRGPVDESLAEAIRVWALLQATVIQVNLAASWFGFAIGVKTDAPVSGQAGGAFQATLKSRTSGWPRCPAILLGVGVLLPGSQNKAFHGPQASSSITLRNLSTLGGLALRGFGRYKTIYWFWCCFSGYVAAGGGRARNGIKPAGLRAGRATRLFQEGVDIGRLRMLGRWSSAVTLEHYVREATATMALSKVPLTAQREIARYVAKSSVFAQPPSAHWSHFFTRTRQIRSTAMWRMQTGA